VTVNFNEIAPTTRTPFVFVEFDATRAAQGLQAQPYQHLLIGQKRTGAGTVAALTLVRLLSKDQASQFFGAGSQLAQMAAAHFANNLETPTWAIAVADPSGTAATGTYAFSGSATENATFAAYVGGKRYPVSVTIGESTTAIASALAAAINADTSCAVTASSSLGTVTLTARNVGVLGNDVDLRDSYQDGEARPAGLGVTVTAMSGGTGDVDLSGVWPKLGDVWFNLITFAATDATNLTGIEAELDSRASAGRHVDAYAIVSKAGDFSTVSTLGNQRNAKRCAIIPNSKSPTTPWEFAAMAAAQVSGSAQIDQALPFQTLPLVGALAPATSDRWTQAQRNSLLYSGISTFTVAADGTCQLERVIGTYKTNPQGASDPAYLDANTPLVLSRLRWDFTNLMASRYGRVKVADDDTRFAGGQSIVTPSLVKAEILSLFGQWEALGLVEDVDQFKNDLIVERNASDPSRMDVYMPPNLVNGLRVLAAKIGFIL
jgi:phage tail sheath gpL-like